MKKTSSRLDLRDGFFFSSDDKTPGADSPQTNNCNSLENKEVTETDNSRFAISPAISLHDDGLKRIVEVWPELPESVRKLVLKTVESGLSDGESLDGNKAE